MPAEQLSPSELERMAQGFCDAHFSKWNDRVENDPGANPVSVWKAAADDRLDRLLLDPAWGGDGLDLGALCAIVGHQAGRNAGLAVALGVHAATLAALSETAGDSARKWVEQSLDEAAPIAVVLPDPDDAGKPSEPFECRVTRTGRCLLNGGPTLAIGGGPGPSCVVFARNDQGDPVVAFVQPGATARWSDPQSSLGLRGLRWAELTLEDFELTPETQIAHGESAYRLYKLLAQSFCRLATAAAIGTMRSAHRQALHYAAERYQGGKQIIDHSHLRRVLGEMAADVASGGPIFVPIVDLDLATSLGVKVATTEAAVRVCTQAVQVLGGYGYMKDYGVERCLRDAATLALFPLANSQAALWLAALQKEQLERGLI